MTKFYNRNYFFDKIASYRYLLEKIANENPTPEQLAKIRELSALGRSKSQANFSPPKGPVVSTPPPTPTQLSALAMQPKIVANTSPLPSNLPTINESINKPKAPPIQATIGSGTNNAVPTAPSKVSQPIIASGVSNQPPSIQEPVAKGLPANSQSASPPIETSSDNPKVRKVKKTMRRKSTPPVAPTTQAPIIGSGTVNPASTPTTSPATTSRGSKMLETLKNNKGKAALGLAGLSLAGYGAKKLYDRFSGNQKTASYGYSLLEKIAQDDLQAQAEQVGGLGASMLAGGLASRNLLNRASKANEATRFERLMSFKDAHDKVRKGSGALAQSDLDDIDRLTAMKKRYGRSELLGKVLNNKYTRGVGMGLGAVGMGAVGKKAYDTYKERQGG